jgi:hypothetical protein
MKLSIEIENITEAQAVAIEELLAVWNFLGKSRDISIWTGFWTDGKEDFHPEITVDGRSPERFMLDIGLREGKVKMLQNDNSEIIQRMYFCDYVSIEEALEKNKADE